MASRSFSESDAKRRSFRRRSRAVVAGSVAGHIHATSRELTIFALVSWRSAYVLHGKSESASALPSRCVSPHQRKGSQKFSGINCVATTIQLIGREPATFDCPVDRRFANACGPCCAAWCVHGSLSMRALKTCCYVPMQSLRAS